MQNKHFVKQLSLGASVAVLSAVAFSATPTQESDQLGIPLTITGAIQEVIACEFGGGAEAGLTFDFTAATPEAVDQYETNGSADLTIDCTNGSDGNSYAVAMDTVDGDTPDYENRSADVAVTVGGEPLTAIISADQDGAGFQSVDQEFAPIASADTSTFSFRANIQDPAGATGDVLAAGTPELFVRFDGEAAAVGDGPLLGVGPLGGADADVIDAVNGVLNTIGDNDPTPVTGTVFPVITTANAEINNALGGGGGGGPTGIPVAPLDGTPASDVPEEAVLENFDTNDDGTINQDDAPAP